MAARWRPASAVVVAAFGLAGVVSVPPAAEAEGDGGYVAVQPADPEGLVDPPRIGLRVGTPGRDVPVATREGRPHRAARCRFTREAAWEKAIRTLGSRPLPGRARLEGGDRIDGHARLYSRVCDGAATGMVWLRTTTRAGGGALAVLARQAYRQLGLGSPLVRMSPGADVPQLVRVPTWLWIDRDYWRTRRATVSVPGLTARATARPVSVRWQTGDGTTVTCRGAGSPFRSGVDDPAASSPDCGHTYPRAGRMRVTATVRWRVAWTGGGRSGVLPPLDATTRVDVTVVESQAVNRYQPEAGR